MAGGNHDRTKIIANRIIIMVIFIPRENLGIVVDFVIFGDGLVVDINLFVPDFDLLSFEGDHPLDKILGQVLRVLENDDVVPPDVPMGKEDFFQAELRLSVSQLVDEQKIPNEEGGLHRAGGNLEGLNDKSHDKKDKYGRLSDELKVLSKNTFFARSFLLRHQSPRQGKATITERGNSVQAHPGSRKQQILSEEPGRPVLLECRDKGWIHAPRDEKAGEWLFP